MVFNNFLSSWGIRGLFAKWTDEASVRCEKCTVIMLTLRGWNSVEWLNQFILHDRGWYLATGNQMGRVILTYQTCKRSQLRKIFQEWPPWRMFTRKSNLMFLSKSSLCSFEWLHAESWHCLRNPSSIIHHPSRDLNNYNHRPFEIVLFLGSMIR